MIKKILILSIVFLCLFVPFTLAQNVINKFIVGKQDISNYSGVTPGQTFTRPSSGGYNITLNSLDWVGVDVAAVYGGGVNRTSTSLQSAITAIGTSNTVLLYLSPGTWTISASLSFPSNIYVHFSPGASFAISNTFVATFASADNVIARPGQTIFSGLGSVAFTSPVGDIWLDWFGTDATAFARGVSSCPSYGTVKMLNKKYTFATSVTVDKDISIWMEGAGYINYTGGGTGLLIKRGNFSNSRISMICNGTLGSTNTDNWTAATSKGIVLGGSAQTANITSSHYEFPFVVGFYVGVTMQAVGYQINNNEVTLGDFTDNATSLYLLSQTTGQIANNKYIFTGNTTVSADHDGTNRQAILIEGDGSNKIFNNKFYGLSCDIDAADGTSSSVVFSLSGTYLVSENKIYDAYTKGIDYLIYATEYARQNSYRGRLEMTAASAFPETDLVLDTGYYPGSNYVDISNRDIPQCGLKDVFPISDLYTKAIVIDRGNTACNIMFPGFSGLSSAGVVSIPGGAAHGLYDGYIQLSGTTTIGRMVDTNTVKSFWLNSSYYSTNDYGQYYYVIKCYGAGGAALGVSGVSYVQGSATDMYSVYRQVATASYGGAYTLAGAGRGLTYINFHADVKKAYISIHGTAGQSVKMFSCMMRADEPLPASWLGFSASEYPLDVNYVLRSPSSPVGGFLAKGDIVWDMNAATGAAPGWYCVAGNATTATVGEPAGETSLVVGNISGMATTDILGVILDNDFWFWTSINGAPSGGTVVMTNAVPTGRHIDAGAPVTWFRMKEFGNLD